MITLIDVFGRSTTTTTTTRGQMVVSAHSHELLLRDGHSKFFSISILLQVVVSAHSHELLLRDGGFSRRLKFVSELTEVSD